MGFRVYNQQCATCIFGPNPAITAERLEDYKKLWAKKSAVQTCHTASIAGDNVGCRGHYEAAKREEIPHPIPSLLNVNDENGPLPQAQQMKIAERLGLVEFVPLPKTDTPRPSRKRRSKRNA
jgi:hypothetical protein